MGIILSHFVGNNMTAQDWYDEVRAKNSNDEASKILLDYLASQYGCNSSGKDVQGATGNQNTPAKDVWHNLGNPALMYWYIGEHKDRKGIQRKLTEALRDI